MAATFKVQIFKHVGTLRPWSNVYLLDAADLLAAVDMANSLVTNETNLHYDNVIYDRAVVSSLTPHDDVFETIPLATTGNLDLSGEDYLPLFNSIRVDFHVVGGGRPSRKYFRCPVREVDQVDGLLTSDALTAFQSRALGFVAALATDSVAWVDPDGQAIDSASVFEEVQMRQLHRKRRRTPTP